MLMVRCNFNSFMSRSGLMRHLLFIITNSMNYDEQIKFSIHIFSQIKRYPIV